MIYTSYQTLRFKRMEMIEYLRALAIALGRTPTVTEIGPEHYMRGCRLFRTRRGDGVGNASARWYRLAGCSKRPRWGSIVCAKP